jgi:hypothetical protein
LFNNFNKCAANLLYDRVQLRPELLKNCILASRSTFSIITIALADCNRLLMVRIEKEAEKEGEKKEEKEERYEL